VRPQPLAIATITTSCSSLADLLDGIRIVCSPRLTLRTKHLPLLAVYSAVIERATTDPGIGTIITTTLNPFAQNSETRLAGNPLLLASRRTCPDTLLAVFAVAGFNDAVFRFPTAVALVLGYFIGFVFMETYSVTVSTVVCCFCEDEKYNDGSLEYPYFMQGSLEAVLGPAAEFGRAMDKTKGDIKNKKAEFKKEIVSLKRRQTMDKKERSEADGGKSKDGDDDNFGGWRPCSVSSRPSCAATDASPCHAVCCSAQMQKDKLCRTKRTKT
jgi:hypothetical protein